MKNTLVILLISMSTSISAQLIEDTPLITTNGTAIVYAEPDEVLFSYTIITEGDDLVDARNQNASISKGTIEFLKKQGIATEHIQTQFLNVGIRYRDYKQKPATKYYQASQSISVCLRDMQKYESTMMGLLQMDITSLNSPVFRTTDYRKKMDEARAKAIVAAKEKASALAVQLEQNIGSAYNIAEQDLSYVWRNQNAYANTASGDGSSSPSIEGGVALGQLEIKASVDVSFHLLPNM